jgi:DNA primase
MAGLLEELRAPALALPSLSAAGLVKEAEGKPGTYYDRFRNRLMFPIRDTASRTVAFTGRALPSKEPSKQEEAKYLNSPETDLFKKSRVLFAMDRAKDAIRTRNFAILMEGQLDVLHAHQAGFENAVALSGTALSAEHLALMKRYSENLMLALDGDRAGLAATQKHALAALHAGMRVKAVRLPKGKDPADLISEDPKEFAKRVADAAPVIEFFLAVLSEAEKDQHRLVLFVERIVLPLLTAIQSPIEQEHFVNVIARAIGSTPEAIRASAGKIKREGAPVPERQTDSKETTTEAITDDLRLRALAQSYPDTDLAKHVKSEYARIVGEPMPEGESPERVLFETGILYGEAPLAAAADDIIRRFEKSVLMRAYEGALHSDPKAIAMAEEACSALAKQIAHF